MIEIPGKYVVREMPGIFWRRIGLQKDMWEGKTITVYDTLNREWSYRGVDNERVNCGMLYKVRHPTRGGGFELAESAIVMPCMFNGNVFVPLRR